MLTVILVLAACALVIAIASAATGRPIVWVAVVLLAIIELVRALPRAVPVLVFGFGFLVASQMGCATSRDEVLSRSLAGVQAAEKSFLAYDKAHQGGIIDTATTREQGERSLADYRVQRDKVVAALVAAYGALAVASTDVTDASLRAAVDAMAAMVSALRDLGVIPGGSPGGKS